MKFSECLKIARNKAGLTQKQLAEKTGLSIASIQGYEQDKYNPKIETISKIATALNVSIESLLGDTSIGLMTEFDREKLQYFLNSSKQLDVSSLVKAANSFIDGDNKITGELIKQEHLTNFFLKLNEKGQDKAIEHVEMLTKIPEFQKMPAHSIAAYLNAAHARTDIEPSEEDKKHDDDIMNDDNF